VNQEVLIALGRYTFLLEVKAETKKLQDGNLVNFDWLSIESIANCSPSEISLRKWTRELAVEQYLLLSPLVEMANVFGQLDEGQKGQEVRLVTVWDENDTTKSPDGPVCQLWLDLTYCGKKSDEVAEAMKNSLKKFGTPEPKPLRGATADSGAGTPESYAKACQRIQIWLDRALANSCGIHDLQSDFRLPVQQYIGEGKLGSRNAIQFLHTLFSLYDELNGFKGQWNKMVRAVRRKVYGTEAGEIPINLPNDLLLAIQQPLIT
jgi:hypothetical protein